MGNTTIIELNHDLAGEIEKNPDDFVYFVLEQLRQGSWTGKSILGGKVIAFFHRGDTTEDELWEEFKEDMRKIRVESMKRYSW